MSTPSLNQYTVKYTTVITTTQNRDIISLQP